MPTGSSAIPVPHAHPEAARTRKARRPCRVATAFRTYPAMRTIPFDRVRTLMAVTVVVVGGCSSGDVDASASAVDHAPASTSEMPTSAPTSTSTAIPSTTITPAPADEGVLAAVDEFWDLYLELGAHTGEFDPAQTRARLEERTARQELVQLFNLFQSNALSGYVIRGGIESILTAVELTETTATVRDCYDDTTGLYRIENEERLDTDDPNRHLVLFQLELIDGTWKVVAVTSEGEGCTSSL